MKLDFFVEFIKSGHEAVFWEKKNKDFDLKKKRKKVARRRFS